MALPLIPLLGSQAIRLIGTHSLRHLATEKLFNLGEKALLSRVMPSLDAPLSLGSNFIPGRESLPDKLLGSTPVGIGQMLGKTDVLMDLLGKASNASNGMPAILDASAKVSQLARGLENGGNPASFLEGLERVKPLVSSALSQSPALSALANSILEVIENLLSGNSNQQTMDSSNQAAPAQQQTR